MKRDRDKVIREIVAKEVEKVKAQCRDIFYENMRQQIDLANQPHDVPMIDLVRGVHNLQEVIWPRFR